MTREMEEEKLRENFETTMKYYESFPDNVVLNDAMKKFVKGWFECGFYCGLKERIFERKSY